MSRTTKTLAFIGVLALVTWLAQSWLRQSSPPRPADEESAALSSTSTSASAESVLPEKTLSGDPPSASSPSTTMRANKAANEPPNQESPAVAADKDSRRAQIKAEMLVMGGLEADVIINFVDRQQRPLSYCYERAEGATPGRLIVRLVISPLGRVIEAGVDRKFSTILNEKVEKCVLGVLKRTLFPEPMGGGSVEVSYPLSFPLARSGPEQD